MLNSSLCRRLTGAVIAVVPAVFLTPRATAAPWTNAAGGNTSFGWSGGTSNTNKFGNPTVTPEGFFFFDTVNFIASGGGGAGASATDFARVTVDTASSVPAGAPLIHSFQIKEFGTWSSEISQPTDFTVQADFQVFRFVPTPTGTTGVLPIAVTFFPDGTWTAEATLTAGGAAPPFSNLDWRRFQITVTNTIQVNSAAPSGSTIEKTGMRIITPEPTTVLFLLAGFGPLALRRSRR